jgi:hypothetical protein
VILRNTVSRLKCRWPSLLWSCSIARVNQFFSEITGQQSIILDFFVNQLLFSLFQLLHFHRSWRRGDIPLKATEHFMTKLSELEEIGKASPVIQDDQVSYIYVQYSNLYLLALARNNVNAIAILAFLHKLVEIFKHYFREVSCKLINISSAKSSVATAPSLTPQ